MGGTLTTAVLTPDILIDDVSLKRSSRKLLTMVIHATGDQANMRIEVSGHATDLLPRVFEFGTTEVAVRIDGQDAFSGRLDELELHAPEGEPTSLLLVASGAAHAAHAAHAAPTRGVVPLRYGNELVALSVRRRANKTTARGVVTSSIMQCGSRLKVATPDPAFDDTFTVVELWHRYDATQGARTEFLAEA
jgi:hypothetical protein